MLQPPLRFETSATNELVETASIVASALRRFNGRPVLITTAEEVPVTSGKLIVVEPLDEALFPTLVLEFSMRGLVFGIKIPLGRVFALAGSWTGKHFVYSLPAAQRFWLENSDEIPESLEQPDAGPPPN